MIFYLGGLLIFSPPIMHHTLIFPRNHFSSQEMGVESCLSPYVPSALAHFSLGNWSGMPGGSLEPGGKEEEARHSPSYSLLDRQAVLGAALADLSSHQRVSKSCNIFQCSPQEPCTRELGLWWLFPLPGLAAPSHSPNFVAEWAVPGRLGLGHVKEEVQRRGEGEEGNLKKTAFLQSCQNVPAWGILPPSPAWVGPLPTASPTCHASSAGLVLRHFRESIPETSKPPPRPGSMTCSFSENWQAASGLYRGKRINPFGPLLLLSPSPGPAHIPAGLSGNWLGGTTEEEIIYF